MGSGAAWVVNRKLNCTRVGGDSRTTAGSSEKWLVNGNTDALNLKRLLRPSSSGKNTRLSCPRYNDVDEAGRLSGVWYPPPLPPSPKPSSLTRLKLPDTPDGDLEVQEHPRPTRGETLFWKASLVFALLLSGSFFHLSFQLKGQHPGASLQSR